MLEIPSCLPVRLRLYVRKYFNILKEPLLWMNIMTFSFSEVSAKSVTAPWVAFSSEMWFISGESLNFSYFSFSVWLLWEFCGFFVCLITLAHFIFSFYHFTISGKTPGFTLTLYLDISTVQRTISSFTTSVCHIPNGPNSAKHSVILQQIFSSF